MNKKLHCSALFAIFVGMILSSPVGLAARNAAPDREVRNEFFIISEVRLKRHQLVLEMPTQITKVMFLNDKTVFENKEGHRLPFTDISAGQTVYVTYIEQNGKAVALKIREGPMTVAILHERYFHG